MLLTLGIALWVAGTVLFRVAGHHILHPVAVPETILLFAVSFVAMAALVRGILRLTGVAHDQWTGAAAVIALPTMILDPITLVFFVKAFPNIAPDAASVFAGLMLCCCGGAIAGTLVPHR